MPLGREHNVTEGYFIVWCPHSPTPPRHKHASYEQAEAEAHRLARNNPGKDFVVLQARWRVLISETSTTSFMYEDDIPF